MDIPRIVGVSIELIIAKRNQQLFLIQTGCGLQEEMDEPLHII